VLKQHPKSAHYICNTKISALHLQYENQRIAFAIRKSAHCICNTKISALHLQYDRTSIRPLNSTRDFLKWMT
jgi:hypothetical protein